MLAAQQMQCRGDGSSHGSDAGHQRRPPAGSGDYADHEKLSESNPQYPQRGAGRDGRSASDIALAECAYTAAAVCSSTGRLKPERSLAPGPSVAAAEIQGASAGPSQTFSAMLCRIGGADSSHLPEEEHVQHRNQPSFSGQ